MPTLEWNGGEQGGGGGVKRRDDSPVTWKEPFLPTPGRKKNSNPTDNRKPRHKAVAETATTATTATTAPTRNAQKTTAQQGGGTDVKAR